MADADRCISCGEIVPEGRMVCPACEASSDYDHTKMYETIIDQIAAAAERIKKDSEYIRRRLSLICAPRKGGWQ